MILAAISTAPLGPYASMALLAVIQGATEFLPVSSSGHLALSQAILGVGKGSLFDDVLLHLGTLGAVVVFYRRDLLQLIRGFFSNGPETSSSRLYVFHLLVGSLPAAVVGVGLGDAIEASFENVVFVLGALFVTGLMLLCTRWLPRRSQGLNWWRALLIGAAQALAILPGFSRSGWSISAGLALGLPPAEAARFSFLLSIPAILGATVLQLPDAGELASPPAAMALGVALAFGVGLACLAWLIRLVRNMALYRFTPYLWLVAAVGLWLSRV